MKLSDMLFANAMMGEGGGGGGSSDLSTASLVITFESKWCPLEFASCKDDGSLPFGPPAGFASGDTATVILYKGKAYAYLGSGTATITGDIEYDAVEEAYIITGDCTMAVTGDNS